MWPILFVLLAPANGCSSVCSQDVTRTCKMSRPVLLPLPVNAREVNKLCSDISEYVDCRNSFDSVCSGRSAIRGIEPPLYYNRLKSFLDDVCEETGSYHDVLIRNLPCIKRRVDQSHIKCAKSINKVIYAYDNYLRWNSERMFPETNEKFIRELCLKTVTTSACVLDTIRKDCGFLSYTMAHDILMRTQILPAECQLNIFQELSADIDHLELEDDLKRKFKEYFVVEFE